MDPILFETWKTALASGNPLAIAAAVYLIRVSFDVVSRVREKSNGGTHEEKVRDRLEKIATTGAFTLQEVKDVKRELREERSESRAAHTASAAALSTLGEAVSRNAASIETQNRILERIVDASLRGMNERTS